MKDRDVPTRILMPLATLRSINEQALLVLDEEFDLLHVLQNASARRPLSFVTALVGRLMAICDDRNLAFSLGYQAPISATGSLGIYLSAQSNLATALNEYVRYFPLFAFDELQVDLKSSANNQVLQIASVDTDDRVSLFLLDILLGRTLKLFERIADKKVKLKLLNYPASDYGVPSCLGELTQQIVQRGSALIMALPAASLQNEATPANNEILRVLKPSLEAALSESQRDMSLIQKVRNYLDSLDTLRGVSQAKIAQSLHMSSSSLRRKLADDEILFSDFFQRYRRNKSLEYFVRGDVKLEFLADVLGFSERASFERAFKQWFDISPAKYKQLIDNIDARHAHFSSFDVNALPSSPKVCNQILALLSQDDYDLEELVALVKLDPFLSAKILAISRSAYYGARNIRNLEDAIGKVLGAEKVKHLAIMLAANQSFGQNLPASFDLVQHWAVALMTAQLSSALLPLFDSSAEQNEIYLCGLFFHIGAYIFASFFPIQAEQFMTEVKNCQSADEARALEKQVFGLTIYAAGALLLARWDLPKQVFTNVRQLELPENSRQMSIEAKLLRAVSQFVFGFRDLLSDGDSVDSSAFLAHCDAFYQKMTMMGVKETEPVHQAVDRLIEEHQTIRQLASELAV